MITRLFFVFLLALLVQTSGAQLVCKFGASATQGCGPLVIDFTDSSSGNPSSWYWNFGNGDTSFLQNPIDSFIDTGTYHVFLRVSNGNITDSQYLSIRIFPKPTASFSPSSTFAQCPPFPVQFNNTSAPNDSSEWLWYYGDGDTSHSPNPYHIYKFPEKYSVTLIGINPYGCKDSVTYVDLIQVKGPIGHFNAIPDSGCPPLLVTFSGTAQSTASSIFVSGDGASFSNIINTAYTFRVSGTYYPVYTLTDSFGCQVAYEPGVIRVLNCDTLGNGLTDMKSLFTLGPNPTSELLNIKSNDGETYKMELFDASGQELSNTILTFQRTLNIASVANGIYVLKLENIDSKQFTTKKVVILH